MWPFNDKRMQKAISIVLVIAGLFLIFFPIEGINSFAAGIILGILGAIYLIDLQ